VADLLAPLCDLYFRGEVRGLERVPSDTTLLVANHDGGCLPFDTMVFGHAWHRYHDFKRPLRVLMHEIPFKLGRTLRDFLHACGLVSACPPNMEAALEAGEATLVLPGAAREAFRRYKDRRDIDLGGRTGFVQRSLRRRIPITPVVTAGAHETMFILTRGQTLATWVGLKKAFKADAWPLALGLPWGIWFGPMWPYLPLPSKITVEVLEPIEFAKVIGRPARAN
jgi:1-acyl-sn-glycerol-3-phosphate acyltransferase